MFKKLQIIFSLICLGSNAQLIFRQDARLGIFKRSLMCTNKLLKRTLLKMHRLGTWMRWEHHSLQVVELSRRSQTAVQIVWKAPAPAMGPDLLFMGNSAMRTRWKAGIASHKSGWCRDKSRSTHKQVWICNICHKQIHGRKHISIMCTGLNTRCI